jgi:hypothetical protein
MPRKPWVPLGQEKHLFHEIYIDETSQNDHHYMVIGGIVAPLSLSAQLSAEIDEAKPSWLRGIDSKGHPREAGWKLISKGDFKHYAKIVDTYRTFGFRRLKGINAGEVGFYCSIIDLRVKNSPKPDVPRSWDKSVVLLGPLNDSAAGLRSRQIKLGHCDNHTGLSISSERI